MTKAEIKNEKDFIEDLIGILDLPTEETVIFIMTENTQLCNKIFSRLDRRFPGVVGIETGSYGVETVKALNENVTIYFTPEATQIPKEKWTYQIWSLVAPGPHVDILTNNYPKKSFKTARYKVNRMPRIVP